MHTRRFVMPVAAASLVMAAAFVSAQPENQPARGPGQNGQPGGPGGERRGPRRGDPNAQPQSLDGAMRSINRGFDRLRKQIDKPESRAENLQILGDMQRAAVAAKGFKPTHMPADGQEAYLDDYRLRQVELLSLMLRAETGLIKKDFAAAGEALNEMVKLGEESHQKFAPGEEEEDEKDENGGK